MSDDFTERYDPDCAFCGIVHRKEPAEVVHRWADAVAFVPLHPATAGHVLVAPVGHAETLWDLPSRVAQRLMNRVLTVSQALRDVSGADGLNIIQSNGAAATQTVPHVHIHCIPRYDNDNMQLVWPSADLKTEKATEEIAGLLRAALA